MITWMQRHRKYLVITIWVSTIAFIGAGFVGWGQYSYGSKSGAVAKVGDVSISAGELQSTYSQLFNRYSQVFQGNFDQEQAKKFGLDKQALQQLVNQALLINLANSYNLEATDKEVAQTVASQKAFYENGVFSKELYHQVLKQNRLSAAEYETTIRKSLLIEKVLALFPAKAAPIETDAFETAMGIADKIEYKVLTGDAVRIDASDAALKAYWETHKNDYLTPRAFKIAYIEQAPVSSEAGEEELQAYYDSHKYDFTGPDGKLLDFATAKNAVIAAVNDQATNKAALKTYIAFKKEKLVEGVKVTEATVTETDATFSPSTLQAIAAADPAKPYLKPKKDGNRYLIIKVLETVAPVAESFEAAKARLTNDYRRIQSREALLALAQKSADTFKGTVTEGYLKRTDTTPLTELDAEETQELIENVFASGRAVGTAELKSGKVVLFRILDQKLQAAATPETEKSVEQIKTALLSQRLIRMLGKRYETQVFLEGYEQ